MLEDTFHLGGLLSQQPIVLSQYPRISSIGHVKASWMLS